MNRCEGVPGGLRRLLPLLVVLAGSAACDGSSPTRSDPPSSSASIVFVDPQALAAHEEAIVSLTRQTVDRTDRAIPVGFVRFQVTTTRRLVIPEWGLGGLTLGPNDVEIAVDPDFPGLAQVLPQNLPQIVAHELHHCVRWQGLGYSYGTLLEALATEGLADHFAIELLGAPIPPWSDAFAESQTALYLARARPELDSPTYDHPAWFLGARPAHLPRWTGYTLGFRLVRDYLESHQGSSAAGLVHASPEAFRPPD